MLTIEFELKILPLQGSSFSFLPHILLLFPKPPLLFSALVPLGCGPIGGCWPIEPPLVWDHAVHRTLGGTADIWRSACHPVVWPWSPGKGSKMCGCRKAPGEHVCYESSARSTRRTHDLHLAPWHRENVWGEFMNGLFESFKNITNPAGDVSECRIRNWMRVQSEYVPQWRMLLVI